ncbi:MAG: hypothetical protein J5809_05750 [Selenomonadaceae bacterium]|nr:hypothetical protein [Selenomonadaceae bacterium]
MFEEKNLTMDFSRFSRVKESLRMRLILRHRADNEAMSMEEMDYVAAAGTPTPKKPEDTLKQ